MCVLDLTVVELGIRGMWLEDGPSIVLNCIELLRIMNKVGSGAATPSTYASFFSLLFSTFMIGRKSGLPTQRKELLNKKGEIEAEMKRQGMVVE